MTGPEIAQLAITTLIAKNQRNVSKRDGPEGPLEMPSESEVKKKAQRKSLDEQAGRKGRKSTIMTALNSGDKLGL